MRAQKILIAHNPLTGEKTYAVLQFLTLGTEVIEFQHVRPQK